MRTSKIINDAKTFDQTAQRYADLFIASYHISGAEALARRILEKVIANKNRLLAKYPGEKLL